MRDYREPVVKVIQDRSDDSLLGDSVTRALTGDSGRVQPYQQ